MPLEIKSWYDKLSKSRQLMAKLPRMIGVEAVNFSMDRFRDQAWHDHHREPWPQTNSESKRAMLIKSGRLRRSVRVVRATNSEVVIGSDVIYAQVHNDGGTVHPTVTENMRKFAWAMTKKDPKRADMWKGLALTKKTRLDITIKRRRFLGPSEKFNQQANELIKTELKRVFN